MAEPKTAAEPKAEVAEVVDDAAPAGGVDYFAPEGEEEVADAGAAAESEGEATDEATADTVEGKAPVAPVAATPAAPVAPAVIPPLPTQPVAEPLARYQQTIDEQAARLAKLELDRECDQLAAQWRTEGYSGDQINKALDQHRQYKEREVALQAREKAIHQALAMGEQQAKVVSAKMLALQYGVSADELIKADTPATMEAIARALKAEAEVAKLKQSKVRPTKLASAAPGSQGATSRSRLVDMAAAGKELTPAQWAIVNGG